MQPVIPFPKVVKTGHLLKGTGLSRMQIGRLAHAGFIPGACRNIKGRQWRFVASQDLEEFILWKSNGGEPHKRYKLQSRNIQRIRSGEASMNSFLASALAFAESNPANANALRIQIENSDGPGMTLWLAREYILAIFKACEATRPA